MRFTTTQVKLNEDRYIRSEVVTPLLVSRVCVRCFGEDTCLSVPDVKAVVMVLPPSEPRITITGSNRLVRPAADLQGPLGVAPFKELHITSTVMKGGSFGGCEWRGCGTGLLRCSRVIMFQLMCVAVNEPIYSLWKAFYGLLFGKLHIQIHVAHIPMYTVHRPGVMEVMHNLDYCDILVIGEELSPERESLEIHHNALLGKHLDATNSTSGISIYGRKLPCSFYLSVNRRFTTFSLLIIHCISPTWQFVYPSV